MSKTSTNSPSTNSIGDIVNFEFIRENMVSMRRAAGMTIKDTVKILEESYGVHVDRTTLVNYEVGKTQPRIDFMFAIAEVYGVSISDLFAGAYLTPHQHSAEGNGKDTINDTNLMNLLNKLSSKDKELVVSLIERMAKS